MEWLHPLNISSSTSLSNPPCQPVSQTCSQPSSQPASRPSGHVVANEQAGAIVEQVVSRKLTLTLNPK
eukprot:scaffold2297_cov153-Ochromonas_danica.AAC.14